MRINPRKSALGSASSAFHQPSQCTSHNLLKIGTLKGKILSKLINSGNKDSIFIQQSGNAFE